MKYNQIRRFFYLKIVCFKNVLYGYFFLNKILNSFFLFFSIKIFWIRIFFFFLLETNSERFYGWIISVNLQSHLKIKISTSLNFSNGCMFILQCRGGLQKACGAQFFKKNRVYFKWFINFKPIAAHVSVWFAHPCSSKTLVVYFENKISKLFILILSN